MIAFQVKDIKNFMSKLLTSSLFDSYLLEEATITTYNKFFIDGHSKKEFFQDEPLLPAYEFSTWSDMRSLCFELIKGKRTPIHFKFVLHLMPEQVKTLLSCAQIDFDPDQIKAFILNIKYDGNTLTCITATAFHTFILDKSPDKIWDQSIRQFLTTQNISFDEL